MPTLTQFKMSQLAATAAAGVEVTNAEVLSQSEAAVIMLENKDCQSVAGVCTDYSGNTYVADNEQHCIFKISEGGAINIWAGSPGDSGRNGTLQNVATGTARFYAPTGICCDRTGNVYVADTGNNQIRKIDQAQRVSVIAGNGSGTAGLVNGDFGAAMFNGPQDICVDNSGVLYVADTGNHTIRKIYNGSTVISIAGAGSAADAENIRASNQLNAFDTPRGIAVDNSGNIYVADTGNRKIKKIIPKGWIYLHSGTGTQGRSLGASVNGATNAYTCTYDTPRYLNIDSSGNLYIIDVNTTNGSRLVKLNYDGVPSVVADFNPATTYSDFTIGVAVSPAQKLFVTIATSAEANSSSSSVDSSSSSSVDSSSSSSVDSSSSSSSEGYSSSSSSSVDSSSSSSVDSSSSSSS